MIGAQGHSTSVGWKVKRCFVRLAAVSCMLTLFVTSAQAVEFDLGPDMNLGWTTTTTYSAAMRMKDADNSRLSDINRDDGNRAFKKHDLVSNRFNVTSDLDFSYKNYGAFLRGNAFYDFAYDRKSKNSSPETHNDYIAGITDSWTEYSSKSLDLYRDDAEFLDAFVYGNFNVLDRNLQIKVGQQVVSWGESLFFPNGVSFAQGMQDFSRSKVPGRELKEQMKPSGSVHAQLELTDSLEMMAYYQWDWDAHQFDGSGSYYSTVDYFATPGFFLFGEQAPPGIPGVTGFGVTQGETPDDGGYGFALTYVADWLQDTEFGLYYLRYNDKLPGLITLDDSFENFVLGYQQDIDLYAASFSSVLYDVNISGEVAWKKDYLLAVGADGADHRSFDYMAYMLSALFNFGPIGQYIHASDLAFEAAATHVLDADKYDDELTMFGDKADLTFDSYAFGCGGEFAVRHFNLFPRLLPGTDLKVKAGWEWYPNGHAADDTIVDGQHVVAGSLNFDHTPSQTGVSIGYQDWIGDNDNQHRKDRDYMSFSIKRSF